MQPKGGLTSPNRKKDDVDDIMAESQGAKKEVPSDLLEESLSSSSASTSFDTEMLSPKQSLINGLSRLADTRTQKYSLTDRELFIFDLDGILKVLTTKEVVNYVFPALEAFVTE